jgi:predicted MPP superfamily phosphohydrolase
MATTNTLAEKQVAEPRERKAAAHEATHAGIGTIAVVFQSVMLAAHWFVYETWSLFWGPMSAAAHRGLALSLAVLSFSFLGVTLLAFRANKIFIRIAYRVAAVWLGALNFFVFAAVASWLVYGFVLATSVEIPIRWIAGATFGVAALVTLWGVANANWIRVKKISVRLPNLPDVWRGRTAVLASDLHLGHVHHRGFSHRIVRKIGSLKPDVVFLAGDFFDGTQVDAREVAAPWKYLHATFGTYFVAGNHELFRGESAYLDALRLTGIRVLQNEKVVVDGLQILGVPYHHATHAEHFRSVLAHLAIDPESASILLTHAPDRPAIAAEAGIGLQLSGHTHCGQFFPFASIARRIYGQFTYGLSRLRETQFYVSSGAGTWGPPLRIGSQSEIVQITFE